jgi:hypothetical protein
MSRQPRPGMSFVQALVWIFLLGVLLYAVVSRAGAAPAAQSYADTCSKHEDSEGDPIRAWMIGCVNGIAVDQQAIWRFVTEQDARMDAQDREIAALRRALEARGGVTQADVERIAWEKADSRLFLWKEETRAGRDPFLADYTRQRACQFGRANILAKGGAFAQVCP